LQWSLDHLHPDTRRAIVNAGYRRADAANRLFWRVDDDTLLGRFYLLHMIGIRPDVVNFTIGAACDYSFIPELCPSDRVEVLTDSDEYFVAEMQASGDAGPDQGRPPALAPRRVAADLSRWTTARHRANAKHTILFHAADLPARLAEIRAEADSAIAAISRHLAAVPQPHRGHPSWIGGTALRRATTGRRDLEQGRGLRGAPTRLWWQMRLAGFGRPPDVRPWHPRWPDFAPARARLGGAVLILSDEPRSFARWASPAAADPVSLPRDRLDVPMRQWHIAAAESFDRCLLVLPEDAAGEIARVVDILGPRLTPGGEVIILAVKDLRDDPGALDPARLEALECGLRRTGWAMRCFYPSAGPVRRAVQRGMVDTARATRRGSGVVAASAFVACGVLALLSCACNQIALWAPAPTARRPCSSALFILRRRTMTEADIPARSAQAASSENHADAR
jgi:hypothetical protein